MVLLDIVHPPAVSTSLAFALRSGAEDDVVLFAFALSTIVALVVLQRIRASLLPRLTIAGEPEGTGPITAFYSSNREGR